MSHSQEKKEKKKEKQQIKQEVLSYTFMKTFDTYSNFINAHHTEMILGVHKPFEIYHYISTWS